MTPLKLRFYKWHRISSYLYLISFVTKKHSRCFRCHLRQERGRLWGNYSGLSLLSALSFPVGVCHQLSPLSQLINRCMGERVMRAHRVSINKCPPLHGHGALLKDRGSTIHFWCLEKSDEEVYRKKHNKLEFTARFANGIPKASQ